MLAGHIRHPLPHYDISGNKRQFHFFSEKFGNFSALASGLSGDGYKQRQVTSFIVWFWQGPDPENALSLLTRIHLYHIMDYSPQLIPREQSLVLPENFGDKFFSKVKKLIIFLK